MSYVNHFGEKSWNYLQYRPVYPQALYDYLASLCPGHELAWDCATGNGQAAVQLAKYFSKVIASDVSQEQLNVAVKKNNIQYQLWPAEKTTLLDQSVDLITVAQALHWFNLNEFYREVRRIAKLEGIIAVWCYPLGTINTEIDIIIKKLYDDILGSYWPKERHYIDDDYKTIPFPFKKIKTPQFKMEKNLNLEQLLGYLHTWSAVKEYQQENHDDPINKILSELQHAWGKPESEHIMQWPISLIVGSIFEYVF